MSALGAAGHMDVRLKVTKLLEKNCQEEGPEKWQKPSWVIAWVKKTVMPFALPCAPFPEARDFATVAQKCAQTLPKCAEFGSNGAKPPQQCRQKIPKCARPALKSAPSAPNPSLQPVNAFSSPSSSLRQYSHHSRSWCTAKCAWRRSTLGEKHRAVLKLCTKHTAVHEAHSCAQGTEVCTHNAPSQLHSCTLPRKLCTVHAKRAQCAQNVHITRTPRSCTPPAPTLCIGGKWNLLLSKTWIG